ncbi:hypothetical protein ACH5RR_032162 [Cinchona calisaya]|uniref:Uncharacterized protein n=1 Tax=Cinchona calisaya TaxID=153742 RepID=A0ABD2YHB6_9GENT
MATFLVLMLMIIAPNIRQLAGLSMPSESFESGRHLMQTQGVSEQVRQSDDTVRADPLNQLKKYRGGYDITNKHYWSSTAFTGIYGYAIAILWLLCGVIYGVYLLVTSFCCRNNRGKSKKRSPCPKQFYLGSILVAVLFTILAITGCGLVLGGNAKFHSRAKTVVDILIDTADDASNTIHNTTGAMKDMRDSLAASTENTEATEFLTSTSQNLDTEAADISRQARKNRRAINKGLKIVYIITTVTISLNLIAAIALSDDTCTALEGFQQDPYNNSLSSILPCDELLSAKSVLSDVSAEVYRMVNEVNRNISRTYGNIVQICNPFSAPPEYQYQAHDCPANTVQIGDIPQLLKLSTCPDSEGETCKGGIVISARDYNMVEVYTTSIQRLLSEYPGMESLVQCQTVTNAFSEILNKHCKPLSRYTRMVWAAMVFLSVVMVALILIWTTEAHHEQYLQSSDGSVKSYSSKADMIESGTAEASIRNSSTV